MLYYKLSSNPNRLMYIQQLFFNKTTWRQANNNNNNNMCGKIPKLSALRGFVIFFFCFSFFLSAITEWVSEWVSAGRLPGQYITITAWREKWADTHGSAKSPDWTTAGYDKDEWTPASARKTPPPPPPHTGTQTTLMCKNTHPHNACVFINEGFQMQSEKGKKNN